jgi:hypothetical protein
MTKNINCRHCQKNCKKLDMQECENYKPKADRPSNLPKLINEAIVKGDMELVKKLHEEQDAFFYGKC